MITLALVFAALLLQQAAHVDDSYEDARAIVEFQRAADRYAFLHRQLERGLHQPATVNDPAALQQARMALVEALRRARPSAGQGDVFVPALQAALRKRLLHADTPGGDGNGASVRVGDVLPIDPALADRTLVMLLPKLPDELMYRLNGRTLLLVDAHVGLVIDLMPGALMGSRD